MDEQDTTAMDPNSPAQANPTVAPAQSSTLNQTPTPDFSNLPPETRKALLNQHLDQEADHLSNDFALGYIKPKTYQDLFAKQETPGKIATLFGLLVGGAGSGLTHQPNALLQMMDNQIKNDLEAQQKTNENAQNYYRLGMQHAKQAVEIPNILSQTRLNDAQTSYHAANTSLIAAKLHVLQNMQDAVDKLPPGPAKVNAQNTLDNTIKPTFANDIKNHNMQTANALVDSQTPNDLSGPSQEQIDSGIDWNRFNALKNAGEAAVSANLPVIVGKGLSPHDAEEVQRQAGLVTQNRLLYKNFVDGFKKLDNQWLTAGRLNPADRQAIVDPLAAQLVRLTGTSTEEANKVANSLFPEAGDWGDTRKDKLKSLQDKFKFYEADTPALDSNHLKTPFPKVSLEEIRKGNNEQKVKIQGPDGTIRLVPASSVDKYVKKGGKVVQ